MIGVGIDGYTANCQFSPNPLTFWGTLRMEAMALIRIFHLVIRWLVGDNPNQGRFFRWVGCLLGKHWFIGEENGYSMYCKTCRAYWQNTPMGGFWLGFKPEE